MDTKRGYGRQIQKREVPYRSRHADVTMRQQTKTLLIDKDCIMFTRLGFRARVRYGSAKHCERVKTE